MIDPSHSVTRIIRPFDTYFNDMMKLSHCAVDILPRTDIGSFEKILFLCSHEHNGNITHLLLHTYLNLWFKKTVLFGCVQTLQ